MNTMLPKFVSDTVLQLTLDYTPVAYLLISKDGVLNDLGGDLGVFGLEQLVLGHPVYDYLLFINGMLPLEEDPVMLAAVELWPEHYADIHLIPSHQADWVILFDRSRAIHWRGQAQQKANELNLLRKKLSKMENYISQPVKLNNHQGSEYCNALNILPLEYLNDGNFRLLGPIPVCFQSLYPEAFTKHDFLHPDIKFSFVGNFLNEAQYVWDKGASRIKSGPWVESDEHGKEHALEASAASWNGKKLLMIELVDDVYEEQRNYLQMGRENALAKQHLEKVVRQRTAEIRAREEEIALRLVWAAESRDDGETGAHIRRIGLYCEVLAETIGWNRSQIDEIRIASTMHDIGKIGIPDSVLRKPDKLTPEEYKIMQTHPIIGGRILSGSTTSLLRMAKDIALGHHEKWDGSGYPNGLSGEEIPLSARMVAISDVFDALIQERVYKKAFNKEETINIMQKGKGTHFDPDLFDVFISLLDRFMSIANEHSTSLFEGFRGNPRPR